MYVQWVWHILIVDIRANSIWTIFFSQECQRTFGCWFLASPQFTTCVCVLVKSNIHCVRFIIATFLCRLFACSFHLFFFEWNYVRDFSFRTCSHTHTFTLFIFSIETTKLHTVYIFIFILWVLMCEQNGIPILSPSPTKKEKTLLLELDHKIQFL